MSLITASLVAQNTFSDPIGRADAGQRDIGIGISGTWAGTLTVQRSLDGGTTWGDTTTTTTANAELTVTAVIGALYRIGFKTGAYTSGTAAIKLL